MNVFQNISLKKYNTFGIDVQTKYLVEINSLNDLHSFIDDKKLSNQPVLVLGGGSNILFTKNFDGVVIKNNLKGMHMLSSAGENQFLQIQGGECWHDFVMYCVKNNLGGVENLSLIPGSVGAAPIQNIGAYGAEQKEVFFELEAIHLKENRKVVFRKSDCHFGYRDSIFKREAKGKFIITSVTFCLRTKPVYNIGYGAIKQELEKMNVKDLSVAMVSQAVCNIRRQKLPDPAVIGNAGSFFKNPTVQTEKFEILKKEFPTLVGYQSSDKKEVKLAAGWLIEQCGWKGKRVGNTGVHAEQALVLVNYGGAVGNEVYDFSENVLQSVKQKFDILLEREVVLV